MTWPPSRPDNRDLRLRFWRRVRALTGGLLALWLVVSVAVPWFARDLDQWQVGRFPLGFWLNAQGAIVVFVGLVVCYAWVMDRLDRAYLASAAEADGTSGAVRDAEP